MGTLGIVGLGLIGGSLGLAIKRAEPVDTTIIGYDRKPDVANRALQAKAVDRLVPEIEDLAKEATLIIVATPIISMRKVFETMAPYLRPNVVVTDTASTKSEVLRWARDLLPRNVHFVGGHPMAGKEKSGPQAAEASLFEGRTYCIVPGMDAGPGAVQKVLDIVAAVGAVSHFMDADEHDSYAAAISHVPLVASLALFNLAHDTQAWPELAAMTGPGFRDLTRLASGQPEMAHDIFLTNQANIIHWLDRYIGELMRLAEAIAGDDGEGLFRKLVEIQMERDSFLENPPKRDRPEVSSEVDIPGAGETFMHMMAGNLWRQRANEIMKTMEDRQAARKLEERMRRRE